MRRQWADRTGHGARYRSQSIPNMTEDTVWIGTVALEFRLLSMPLSISAGFSPHCHFPYMTQMFT